MARQGPGTTQVHVYNLQHATTLMPDIKRKQVPQDEYKTISNSTKHPAHERHFNGSSAGEK